MIEFDPTKSVLERCLQAGSRTYYFDIKKTKLEDYFLIISERKKDVEGKLLKSQKIFLYKEHFESFAEILNELWAISLMKKEKRCCANNFRVFLNTKKNYGTHSFQHARSWH